ncbi:hypothetical protein [Marinomonas sp. 2405UD68-3]|uniref:hypothetical protein n=1 Tax=Marinomonas sp. 2405UD68-3 TaxID=3391835 RepID=UPI0039C9E05D
MQTSQLVVEYWLLVVITCSTLFLIIAMASMKNRLPQLKVGIGGYVLVSLVFVLGLMFLARGGLQSKPIYSLIAYSWPSPDLGPLVLNTPFTFMREKVSEIKRMGFYESEKEAYFDTPRDLAICEQLQPCSIAFSTDFRSKLSAVFRKATTAANASSRLSIEAIYHLSQKLDSSILVDDKYLVNPFKII